MFGGEVLDSFECSHETLISNRRQPDSCLEMGRDDLNILYHVTKAYMSDIYLGA